MNPEESSPPVQPAAPAPALPPASSPEARILMNRPPGHITVIHPAGFTAYAADGADLKQPLFARVTYRPH